MTIKHLLKFSQIPPQEKGDGGARIRATKENFPLLQGMSFYKVLLNPRGIREPHWHANADELGLCLQGKALIHLYHTSDARSTFLVQAGDAFFIPSGALHHIENIENAPAEFILCFSNEAPEDFNLSNTLGAFSKAVLGNTWHVKEDLFKSFKAPTTPVFAVVGKGAAVIPDEAFYKSPYRYNLLGSEPIVKNDGGSAQMARQNFWPILKRQALYSLVLTSKGMREPHWHPETAELGYVNEGRGRMSILSPSGEIDTYEMEKGDIYFIPKAYPHHIENLDGACPLHLLIFFDQALPEDIGFTASIPSYSKEVLEAVTHLGPEVLNSLNKYYNNLFIVDKLNPLDKSKSSFKL